LKKRNKVIRKFLTYCLFLWCTVSNAQVYFAPGSDIGITSGAQVTVLNMDVENRGDVDHAGDLEVVGSFQNEQTFTNDGAIVSRFALTGDWTNNAAFTSGIGLTVFDGTDQTIQGSSNTNFYDLSLNGSAGNVKTLLTNGSVANTLNISDVQFDITDRNFNIMNCLVPISRVSGFISTDFDGRLQADFPSAVAGVREIPLGYVGPSGIEYRPVYVNDGQTGQYLFTLVGENPSLYGMTSSELDDSLCSVLDDFFYRIETVGNSLEYGLYRKPSEFEFTGLSRWTSNWTKWTGSGPIASLPTENLGISPQGANTSYFVIFGKEMPFVDAGPDILITQIGQTVTIKGKGFIPTSANILWSPPDDLSCLSCLEPDYTSGIGGVYTINVDNGPGCVALDSMRILVVRDEIILPNAFSPNTDGLNDFYQPFLFPNERLVNFKIFNRWGEKVHDSDLGWDGNYMGTAVQPGVYTFIMRIEQKGMGFDKQIHKKGTITLIR